MSINDLAVPFETPQLRDNCRTRAAYVKGMAAQLVEAVKAFDEAAALLPVDDKPLAAEFKLAVKTELATAIK